MHFFHVHVCCWLLQACLFLRTGYLRKSKAQGQRRNTMDFRGLAQESWGNLLDWGYLLFWPEKTHVSCPCTSHGCSAAELCWTGLPEPVTPMHTLQKGFIQAHMVSGFLWCKPESLKKSSQLQQKYRKLPWYLLEQSWAFPYRKPSHIAGWATPWLGWWLMGAPAWGSQDHIKAVLVGTACPCSTVGRINHPEQKKPSPFSVEWSYLFLRRIRFCPGNIPCVMHFTHNLSDSGRNLSSVLPLLSTSASPPAKKILISSTLLSSEKGGSPWGPASPAQPCHWYVPLHPAQADNQMTWFSGCGMGFSGNKLPLLLLVPLC